MAETGATGHPPELPLVWPFLISQDQLYVTYTEQHITTTMKELKAIIIVDSRGFKSATSRSVQQKAIPFLETFLGHHAGINVIHHTHFQVFSCSFQEDEGEGELQTLPKQKRAASINSVDSPEMDDMSIDIDFCTL